MPPLFQLIPYSISPMQNRLPLVFVLLLSTPFCRAQDTEIQSILKLGPEAANSANATSALTTLSKSDADKLPQLLKGLNNSNELAANYLRSAIETITDRALASRSELPVKEITAFLLESTGNQPKARRLAYEILQRVRPDEAARLLPTFENDPSVELRYDAVELLIKAADALKGGPDVTLTRNAYERALHAARHEKQIEKISGELRTLGTEVDLQTLFGFLAQWRIIGPFDNTNLAGFDTVFPPETEISPSAEYDGKTGKVRWMEVSTAEPYGKVDLNAPLGELKEVTGYATTTFNSPMEGPAELRLGCKNGWKIWLNGSYLFGRDEYHRGARIDQYRLPIILKKGSNTLLLKICQNADVKDWTKEWEFQLRVCDSSGTAILATDRPPTPKAVKTPAAGKK